MPADIAPVPPGREPVPCRVVVCRDCCCGTPKITGVDHAAQTARLRALVPVRVSECLDVCEQANVVVVQPSAEGAPPVPGRSGSGWSTIRRPPRT